MNNVPRASSSSHRRIAAGLLVVVVGPAATLVACRASTGAGRRTTPAGPTWFLMPQPPVCQTRYAEPTSAGVITDVGLREGSGLVASVRNTGVFWALNDSGNEPELFAFADDGTSLGRLRVPVDNIDWEDLSIAPCPDLSAPCLYIADTGDNDHVRNDVTVHAVLEPAVSRDAPLVDAAAVPPEQLLSFSLRYPDDARVNVEGFAVLPDASAMVLFEKSDDDGEARIYAYRAPWSSETATLEETGHFQPPGVAVDFGRRITGASMHWSGKLLALRTYTGVFEVPLTSPQDVFASDTYAAPYTAFIGPLTEPQGEAVTYGADGTTLFTISEQTADTTTTTLHAAVCAPAE